MLWKTIGAISLILFNIENVFASKKVLILYAKGGHVTAAKSIETLIYRNLDEVEVVCQDYADQLSGIPRWYYKEGVSFITKYLSFLNHWAYDGSWEKAEHQPLLISERALARFNQPDRILNYINSIRPDVIVTTHFSMAQTLAVLREMGHLRETPVAWTHLDMVSNVFFQQIGAELDMTFLPTTEMEEEWKNVIDPRKVIASGIPISTDFLDSLEDFGPSEGEESFQENQQNLFLSEELKENLESNLVPGRRTVLLMGGSLGFLNYYKIISQVSESMMGQSDPEIQFIAVCGTNTSLRNSLNRWSRNQSLPRNAHLVTTGFISSKEIRFLQSVSDLMISKAGGLTTFETFMAGLPVIMMEGLGNAEYLNAKFLERNGAALYIENLEEIGPAVARLLGNPEQKRLMLENQMKLRRHFNLTKIAEWVKGAEVIEPDSPPQRILELIRGSDKDLGSDSRRMNPVVSYLDLFN